MDNIKNNLQEVKEYTMDRLKMPIFFYYFVILAIWNWDILLLIVKSNLPIESIITLIKEQKFDKWRYICPLLIAIGGNLAFPLIMLGLDYPLTWINKKRNKKAGDIELAKADQEFQIQTKKTGSESLRSLQNRIDTLTKNNESLNSSMSDATSKRDHAENQLFLFEEDNKSLVIKNEELENKVLEFATLSGFRNLQEELVDFIEKLKKLEELSLLPGELERMLQFVLEGEKSDLKLRLDINAGYRELLAYNIIYEYVDGSLKKVRLTPYGVKFFYWLKGKKAMSSEQLEVVKMYDFLFEKNIMDVYKDVAIKIKRGNTLERNQPSLDEIVSLGLIKFKTHSSYDDSTEYYLTTLGEDVLKYIVQNN